MTASMNNAHTSLAGSYSTKLLLLLFVSILVPLVALSYYARSEVSRRIIEEKEDKLFGLARLLDEHLDGTFNEILEEHGALDAHRETKVEILNRELRAMTDFVASGNPGVGVGYYHRDLDAILTYGPSDQFEYHVGGSIEEGHQGLEVLRTGEPMVQTGELVRGNILNCMWPIKRDGQVIGYIWANETVDRVRHQIRPIQNRILGVSGLILLAIYASVLIATRDMLKAIDHIRSGLDRLVTDPAHRIEPVRGSLNSIVHKINDVLRNASFVRIYNKYILDSVVNAVIAVDNEGTVTSTNKAFYRVFDTIPCTNIDGYHVNEVFGGPILDLIHRSVSVGEMHSLETVVFEEKTLEAYSNAILDDRDNNIGVIFVFRDVTVLKQYERQLKEKERSAALGELSLHVAHEVKNPLTSIKGFTQLLGRNALATEKRGRYAEIVDSELNRVNHLLQELLLYGGRSPLKPESVDLSVLVTEVVERYRPAHDEVEFNVEMPPGTDTVVHADRWKIIQMLDNVVQNALDAVAEETHPRIDIRLEGRVDGVALSIRDNGKGFSAEQLERAFQPFFTTKSGGFGFGLSVCYRIVEAHGGDISIDSRQGEYTTISVVLRRQIEEART